MRILLSLCFLSFSALANVMDLNEFFPTRMEDATVTELNKLDLQLSYHYEDDDRQSTTRPAIRYGLIKRLHIEVNNDHLEGPNQTEKGSGRTQAGFQWNFNDQDDWVPSLAIEPMFLFPSGKDVDGIDPSLRLNLTYTLAGTLDEPRGQFHVNYRWDHNANKKEDEQKTGQLIVVGYTHKISSNSSLLSDFSYDRDMFTVATRNKLEMGWVWECMKEAYVALGGGIDVQDGYFNSTLALQKTF